MHYQVLKGLLIASHLIFASTALGIDGKLDFGGSRSSASSLRSRNTEQGNTFTPIKHGKIVKSTDDFENIGVVCTTGGCNSSETTIATNSGDSIETDVHVHVKVEHKHNKTETVEETPDVPIVVGYGGSQLDDTVDDDRSRSLGPQSVFVPDISDRPLYNSMSSFGSKFIPSTPSIGSEIDFTNRNYEGSTISGSFYGTNPSLSPPVISGMDSFGNSFDNLNPSKSVSGFYVTKTPVASRVDYIGRSFQKLDPEAKLGFYPSQNIPQYHPLSSSSFSTSDSDQDVKFKENGIEIKIPYFHSSNHNHYYGENPPPQYIWFSKKGNNFNPVEFKTTKASWSPSAWNRKVGHHRHSTVTGNDGVKCSCKEENQSTSTGLRWYPVSDRRTSSINDPGSQINDKLAPLN